MTAEDAIKILKEYSQYAYGIFHNEQDDEEAFDMAIEALSADAVEVVRCKDCEHYIVGVCRCGSLPYSNFSDLANVWLTPRPEDYCSYGERKEP